MIHGGRSNNGVTSRFWPSQSGHSKPEPKQKHEKAEDIAVCLTCTKKKCRGTAECFRKTKKIGVCEDDEADR